jgi:hypothetical protein
MNEEKVENPEFGSRLAKDLESRDKAKREQVQQEMERLGPAAIGDVLSLVQKEADKRRRRQRFIQWGLIIYGGVIALIVAIWAVRGAATGDWDGFPRDILKSFGSLGGLFIAYAAVSASQKAGTEFLAKYNDPRAIGPLLDALEFPDKKLQGVVLSALVRLLPTLEPQHSETLTAEQRGILRARLKTGPADFTEAALKALSVLGDTAAIPDVEASIQRLERQKSADPGLLTAARTTLSRLEEIRERLREKETLLRPADAVEGDRLLRPAESAGEVDPAVLLRPANSA